ncbi:MAG: hypothetical protein N4A72_10890 [Bacteroidales bacterium]|jgi:hypothetical protein|nr:hypothetical protein [Bacteroidales bacterium]
MQGFIGGSFAKYIREEVTQYNDIDIYFDYSQFIELMPELMKRGVALSEHPDHKIVAFTAKHKGIDVMVFKSDFEYKIEQVMGFTLLTKDTMDKIYKNAEMRRLLRERMLSKKR